MNEELRKYLEKLGLRSGASEDEARLFMAASRELPQLAKSLKEHVRQFMIGSDSYRVGQSFLPNTVNEEERSIDGIITTESRVLMPDWELYEMVEEVLLTEGCRLDEIRNSQLPFQNNHSRYRCEDTIGSTTNVRAENGNIVGTNVFSSVEDDLFTKAKEGHLRDTSGGYRVHKAVYIKPGETAIVKHREFTAGDLTLKVCTEWSLFENSLTAVGADNKSGLRSLNTSQPTAGDNKTTKQGNTKMNEALRNLLISCGMSVDATEEQGRAYMLGIGVPSEMSDTQAIAYIEGKRSSYTPPIAMHTPQPAGRTAPAATVPPAALTDEQRAAITRGEREVIVDEIRTLFEGHPSQGDLLNTCIEQARKGELTADEAGRKLLVAKVDSQNTPGFTYGNTSEDSVRTRMADTILSRHALTSGSIGEDQRKGIEEFRSFNLFDMCRHILQTRGVNMSGMTRSMLVGEAMRHGSGDFAQIIQAVSRTSVKLAFGEIKQTWKEYTGVENLSDFEQHDMIMVGGYGALRRVKEKGEYEQGSFVSKAEAMRLEKFGEYFDVSWEAILADKLNQIIKVPYIQSQRWAETLNILPVEFLLSNPKMASDGKALFHAEHNNLIHGVENALTSKAKAAVAVKAHRSTMLKQKSLDNKSTVPITLSHVMCGTDGEEFVFNALFEGGRAEDNTEAFLRNQKIGLVSEPLVGTGITNPKTGKVTYAGSEVQSFGIGSGKVNPALMMGLLDGNAAPTLREEERMNDCLRMWIRGAASVGVSDFRPLSLATGIAAP